MTPQRIITTVALVGGIAIGIALDHSGRQVVQPLAANQTPAAPARVVPTAAPAIASR